MNIYTQQLLDAVYEHSMKKHLTTRAQNLLLKYVPGIRELEKYFNKMPEEFVKMCPYGNPKTLLAYIYDFTQIMKGEYSRIINLNEKDTVREFLQLTYPYIQGEDQDFAVHFIIEHNEKPLLFFLARYIKHSTNEQTCIFASRYGFKDNKCHSLDEISRMFGKTVERCRQITTRYTLDNPSLLNEIKKCSRYSFISSKFFLNNRSADIAALMRYENLSLCYDSLATIFSMFSDIRLIRCAKDQYMAARPDFHEAINAAEIFKELSLLATSRRYEAQYFPISKLTKGVPKELKQVAANYISFYALHNYNLKTTEDQQILLPQTHINPGFEIEKALERKGAPIHLQELFDMFKQKYPDHKYTSIEQMRSWALRSERVKAIGKTSTYGLAEWKGYFYGTIRDLLIETLEASDKPMKLCDIVAKVSVYFPDTKPNSIATTMQSDERSRFVQTGKGFYGLKSKPYYKKAAKAHNEPQLPFED
ncbi:MAG: hypothetical protein HUK08_05205 [Bacteroidaceae bacterium]|nr:hypothetical protein [Bacteroidaceae bacterium]